MKILVLGLGNTIRGDDGLGIYAVRALREEIDSPDIDVKELQTAGINLLDIITGYDKLFVVDSIITKNGTPGTLHKLNGLQTGIEPYSSHQIGLPAVLNMGEKLSLNVPRRIIIYAVERETGDSYEEGLTPKVKTSVFELVNLIKEELLQDLKEEVIDDGSRSLRCTWTKVSSTGS